MADIARIEERLDRVAAGNTAVSGQLGGIAFQNMTEVMEFSKLMALSGNAVPKHLQGNPGMCLAVCIQAMEWRFSPFAVANKSYEVQSRLCFESQLVHAVIEQRAPIVGRMRHSFEGEGEARICIVTAKLRETGETLEYRSPQFGKITPKNSPLWKTKPDLQLYYNTSRDFCRAYFPDVLLGVYSADELRDHVGPDNAKDVNARPSVADRLKGKGQRGFSQSHVERETRGGVVDESETSKGGAGHSETQQDPIMEKPQASESSGIETGQAGEMPATNSASVPSSTSDAPEAPAETAPQPQATAGENPEIVSEAAPPPDEGAGAGGSSMESAGPALPEGWHITYCAALRRAQAKASLEKYAKEYWKQYGGWDAVTGENRETGAAIFSIFRDNFGNRDAIERELREII